MTSLVLCTPREPLSCLLLNTLFRSLLVLDRPVALRSIKLKKVSKLSPVCDLDIEDSLEGKLSGPTEVENLECENVDMEEAECGFEEAAERTDMPEPVEGWGTEDEGWGIKEVCCGSRGAVVSPEASEVNPRGGIF